MAGYVYMLANRKNGTIYIGVTSDLSARVYQHKQKAASKFTAAYDVNRLVWYETYDEIGDAITREKRLKKWNRAWKIRLIEEHNPNWDDLYLRLNR